jgi:GMP synthase (glutamine-hydrolysing)
MVTEVMPRLGSLTRWLEEAIAAGLPTLGICFGHQLLATLYGGEAGYNPHGLEYGTTTITTTDHARTDPLFSRLPVRFAAHVCHAQSALRLPPDARVLARSALDGYQAFRMGPAVWGVQFHPEFNEHAAAAYCRLRRAALRAQGSDPDALARGCVATPHAARLIGLFADFALGRA